MAASQPSSTSSSPIQPKTQIVNKDDPLGADVEANRSRVKVSGGGVAFAKQHTSHSLLPHSRQHEVLHNVER